MILKWYTRQLKNKKSTYISLQNHKMIYLKTKQKNNQPTKTFSIIVFWCIFQSKQVVVVCLFVSPSPSPPFFFSLWEGEPGEEFVSLR